MRTKHKDELGAWTWENVYDRSDLQIRAVILKNQDDFNAIRKYSLDDTQALKFADAAYNGGMGGLNKERRACQLSVKCNPQMWDGHVENFCMKSKKPLYGGRSACDINRHHVKDVFDIRTEKYKAYFR